MARAYIIRTSEEDEDSVVDAVAGREDELASYDANVEAYELMLTALDAELPADWTAELEKYKGKSSEQIYAMGGTSADMLLASKMNHRERVRMLHFTEQAERRKSEQAYNHAVSKLPSDQAAKDAAVSRYRAKKASKANR